MLTLDDISVSYHAKRAKVPVIQNLSLQLEQGKVLAVLGPSGCGKSTLIQLLSGMISADSGTVSVVSNSGSCPLNPKTHKIAVIPQNCGLLPWKTVRENCLLPLKLRHETVSAEKENEFAEICLSLEVDSLLERFPRELSGGQVQRAALARAFLQEPDLLLMDEPFSALDAITRTDAWALFLKIWRQKQPTTLLVTHSMEEALYLGSEIAVMSASGGQLVRRIQNPYFGQPEPQSAEYLSVRRELREQLRPKKCGKAIREGAEIQ